MPPKDLLRRIFAVYVQERVSFVSIILRTPCAAAAPRPERLAGAAGLWVAAAFTASAPVALALDREDSWEATHQMTKQVKFVH